MRFLAEFERSLGHVVTGSDMTLQGHSAENVEGADLVVYTGAVPLSNPEIVRAKELGIPIIERAALLGQIAPLFEKTIAISGTHGKTTTTGMLWSIFEPLQPTVHIGGRMSGKNGVIGSRDLFITEACEYHRSFLNLRPDIAIVLNIDLDHTDCYKNISEMSRSFNKFVSGSGAAIVNGDDPNCAALSAKTDTVSFGLSDKCLYHAEGIKNLKDGLSYTAYKGAEKLGVVKQKVRGRHNIYNALAAIACADIMGLDFALTAAGLKNFNGVERRFELLGKKSELKIYSDYSHHPSEINSCIASARAAESGRITVIFEPHTYSRTKAFMDGFADALSKADEVILAPVFAARESFDKDVSSTLIARKLIERNVRCVSLDTYCEIIDYIERYVKSGTVIFMGAGDIDKAAHNIFNENPLSNRLKGVYAHMINSQTAKERHS